MFVSVLRKLVLSLIIFYFCEKVQTEKDSPFLKIMQSKYFVDKSLLLRQVLNGNATKIMIAPRGFGKTTNLAMIKHFFEIEVRNGVTTNKELSSNYELFIARKLNILKDKQFVDEHFGQYPIINIDYSTLSLIENYEDYLSKHIEVISVTFSSHKYLLKNKTLWANTTERTLFQNFVSKDVDQNKISMSFKWLSELLHKHFGKRPLVLIDEYDAAVKSFIFKENKDMLKISKQLRESEEQLFNTSYGTIMTGELRLFRGENVSCFVNLGDSYPSQFYGITEKEFEKLIEQEKMPYNKTIEMKNITTYYFGGYLHFENKQEIILHRTESVLHYLTTNRLNVSLVKAEYVEVLHKLCCVKGLAEWLHILLSGKKVLYTHVELTQPIFHNEHISTLWMVMKHGRTEKTTITSVLLLTILYYLGFLTPVDEKQRWFKIANKSAQDELKRILIKSTDNLFHHNMTDFENVYRIMLNKSSLCQQVASTTNNMDNFLEVLKSKCVEEKNIRTAEEIKKKIARWLMEDHLPF